MREVAGAAGGVVAHQARREVGEQVAGEVARRAVVGGDQQRRAVLGGAGRLQQGGEQIRAQARRDIDLGALPAALEDRIGERDEALVGVGYVKDGAKWHGGIGAARTTGSSIRPERRASPGTPILA
jgi:hypothetical protein